MLTYTDTGEKTQGGAGNQQGGEPSGSKTHRDTQGSSPFKIKQEIQRNQKPSKHQKLNKLSRSQKTNMTSYLKPESQALLFL